MKYLDATCHWLGRGAIALIGALFLIYADQRLGLLSMTEPGPSIPLEIMYCASLTLVWILLAKPKSDQVRSLWNRVNAIAQCGTFLGAATAAYSMILFVLLIETTDPNRTWEGNIVFVFIAIAHTAVTVIAGLVAGTLRYLECFQNWVAYEDR